MTLPPKFDDGKQYWLSGKTLNQMGRAIQERTPIAGPGLLAKTLPQGVILTSDGSSNGAGGGGSCQFHAEVADGTFRFLNAGLISGGGMPSNMFVTGELWSVAVPELGTRYIKLVVDTDGNAVTSSDIHASLSPASPISITEGVAPSSFEIDLWVVVNRTPYRVIGCGGLVATPVEALVTSAPEPVCSGDPYVRHYTWGVTTGS